VLATCDDREARDPARAVELARKAVELSPEVGDFWSALGVARYRLGEWDAAIAALENAESLTPEEDPATRGFFLAMSHWRLGHADAARAWYDKAVAWMEKNRPRDEALLRFRAEAEALTGPSGLPAKVFVGP
jgi:tetratricopeptide (TPR) repeat protein